MSINQLTYTSYGPRSKRRQQSYDQLNDMILHYAKSFTAEWEAESLWLNMRADGQTLSQTTFYNRLKKIVESGMIAKKSLGAHKNLYSYHGH